MLVDQEVLYQYALALGMHEKPVAQRGWRRSPSFVEANAARSTGRIRSRPPQAMKLGLHEGDLVVRRILVDGARRLIRASC